jgi:enolase 1/2/3
LTSTLIQSIRGLQILDSRGQPTVEVEVELGNGTAAHASVPSGASTGATEAHELRDGNAALYQGRSVLQAITNVETVIAERLRGADALDQRKTDNTLRELDGTADLSRLGANAVLAVSLATCRAAAATQKKNLYQWIAELFGNKHLTLPRPMVNILSGGLHARSRMDIQDFLFVPGLTNSFEETIHLCARVRAAADNIAVERNITTLIADEGGLSPSFSNGEEAQSMMVESFERAGLTPGKDAFIALDLAASTLWTKEGGYHFSRVNRSFSSIELIALVESWAKQFPIISVEDPLDQEDWSGWKILTDRLGRKLQIVGDDLFATTISRLRRGIEQGIANSVLIKLNQNGTVSGTLDVIREAQANGYATIVSARSGETDDSFIADLSVGTSAGQIKIGSLRGSERLSKYNRLLWIEQQEVPRSSVSHRSHAISGTE